MRQKLVMKFKGVDGWKSTAFMTTQANPDPGLGGLAAYLAAVQAASYAGLLYAERQPVIEYNNAPSPGPYASTRNRAEINLRAADGTTGTLIIPAPLSTLFLPGNERLDLSNGLVDAVIQAAYGQLAAPSGSPWVAVISTMRTYV